MSERIPTSARDEGMDSQRGSGHFLEERYSWYWQTKVVDEHFH